MIPRVVLLKYLHSGLKEPKAIEKQNKTTEKQKPAQSELKFKALFSKDLTRWIPE